MNETTVETRVRHIASDTLNIPVDQMTAESSPETIEAWDSVQHLSLVLALEAQFGVQIDPEEIEEMRTIGAITEIIERRMSA